jgi:hypothetical protein
MIFYSYFDPRVCSDSTSWSGLEGFMLSEPSHNYSNEETGHPEQSWSIGFYGQTWLLLWAGSLPGPDQPLYRGQTLGGPQCCPRTDGQQVPPCPLHTHTHTHTHTQTDRHTHTHTLLTYHLINRSLICFTYPDCSKWPVYIPQTCASEWWCILQVSQTIPHQSVPTATAAVLSLLSLCKASGRKLLGLLSALAFGRATD